MLIQVLEDHTLNFSLIDLFISFWLTKQLSVGVAITKPLHYHIQMWLVMLTQLLGDHMINFSLVNPSISLW